MQYQSTDRLAVPRALVIQCLVMLATDVALCEDHITVTGRTCEYPSDQAALGGVTVTITAAKDTARSSRSFKDGTYSVEAVPKVKVSVEFTKTGYYSETLTRDFSTEAPSLEPVQLIRQSSEASYWKERAAVLQRLAAEQADTEGQVRVFRDAWNAMRSSRADMSVRIAFSRELVTVLTVDTGNCELLREYVSADPLAADKTVAQFRAVLAEGDVVPQPAAITRAGLPERLGGDVLVLSVQGLTLKPDDRKAFLKVLRDVWGEAIQHDVEEALMPVPGGM